MREIRPTNQLRSSFLTLALAILLLSGCSDPLNPLPVPTNDSKLDLANEKYPTSPAGNSLNRLQQPNNRIVPTQLPVNPTASKEAADYPKKSKQEETQVNIDTSKGEISLKLFPDKAPNSVDNFTGKIKSGFYNNLTFHRVEDWVIQGGDPEGDGTGGGSQPTEINDVPFKKGSVGMARGSNIKISNEAQFFICTADCSWLTNQYTNIGEVTSGMEVVEKIEIGDKINQITLK